MTEPAKKTGERDKDVDIESIVDEFLNEESRPKRVGAYFPSEIGLCMRRNYYSYTNPRKTDAKALRIFAIGDHIHSFIAEALKVTNRFASVEEEKQIRASYSDGEASFSIFGRIDDYIITKDGKKIIVEAKSVSDIGRVNEPEEKHLMQIMFYLGEQEADYGILVYLDKKNLDMKQFRIDYDQKVYDKDITRMKDLDLHLRYKKLPPAEYYFDNKKVWECKYCPYFSDCMQAIANNM